ncbi:hypothetical protein PENARI_c007G08166 [Penicillium arizonense]|uniref:Catalase core domain-containing protein n=1 Tax=Penicillium arizonense TaxID=1835702 RepID=A0A1F5LK90_PENAI|nr:hypothetical protein PENARI_c007G08166 [Penicillium arizonense]OGE53624.1 hypothetical protein PENARI_c007G08166 [Penicillium arizonense]
MWATQKESTSFRFSSVIVELPNQSGFLNSYSGHTYKFTKEDVSFKYIKIHMKTQHEGYPLRKIGKLTLDRNPGNYFADIEQAAFSPSNMVPGFAASADPVLQARLFAYPDAARYRLGVNYQQLPTNAAKVPVYSPFERDGKMRFDDNYGGDPNYVNSSLQPTKFYPEVKGVNPESLSVHTEHEKWVGEVTTYTSHMKDDDFIQPAALWDVIGRDPGHQERNIENLAGSISGVKSALFSKVDQDLGVKVKMATEAAIKN